MTLQEYSYTAPIAAILMIMSRSFRLVPNPKFWFEPSEQERKRRVRHSQIWLVFCWIIFTFRHEYQDYLDFVGLRGFYVNSILITITYLVPLAGIPLASRPHRKAQEDDLKH
jgi:hypothetical protein